MIITWLSVNVLPHLLKAVAFGKKKSVTTFRTLVISILVLMYWNQQTLQTGVTYAVRNTDTLKVQFAGHIIHEDSLTRERDIQMQNLQTNITIVELKTDKNERELDLQKDNYIDQILKLYRKKWSE